MPEHPWQWIPAVVFGVFAVFVLIHDVIDAKRVREEEREEELRWGWWHQLPREEQQRRLRAAEQACEGLRGEEWGRTYIEAIRGGRP